MSPTRVRFSLTHVARIARRLFLAVLAGMSVAGAERTLFLSPEAALAAFKTEPGVRVEIVAAEPLVVAPVAFAFDDERRLFVVEGRSYPGPAEGAPAVPEGRVALLTDRDGDGRYDQRTEFATGLSYPNGIAVWRGGVFVTCAPDIWYLKDTDGDGVADEKRVVLTGFDVTRTPQLRISHPTLGLDGKIYFTCGLNNGTVTSPVHPERAPAPFKVADGRFDPDSFVYETTGGRGQYGLTFDPFGRRFVCSNRHPVFHVVLEPAHLQRNPHLAFADTMQAVSKIESEATVWPISGASVSADFIPALMSKPHTGTFTAASGVLFFGGTALGPDCTGDFFICESAQNLVQRQKVRPDGVGFRSEAATPGREFLASTDVRFRPVFLGDGPDGALYVADMHRREIDHPAFVPEEARARLDFEGGKDRGRIYRMVRTPPSRRASSLARDPDELVRGLHSPDEWWRARAQRLLVEQRAVSAVPALAQAAVAAPLAATRVRAWWTLRALGALSPEHVRLALRDPDAGVREQAVRFAAERLSSAAELEAPLLAMAADENARVRFVTALALGSWPDAQATVALAVIAARDGEDRWVRAAVLSGIGRRQEAFLREFARHHDETPAAFGAVMEDLGRLIGAGDTLTAGRHFLREILVADSSAAWRIPAALGLAEGLRGRTDFKPRLPGAPLAGLPEETDEDAARTLRALFKQAVTTALDERVPLARRSAAVGLLGHTDFATGAAGLGELLAARQPPELQLQAVRTFERAGDPRGGELLLQPARWSGYTPQVRGAVIAALLAKPALVRVLLAAIQRGEVLPAEVPSFRRAALLKHPDSNLRAQATALFKSLEGGDRMAVYRDYRAILDQPADAGAGAAVFVRACSACHTYRNSGGKVGPDLTGFRNQPADALLLHILVPNYEVAPGYQAMSVTTRDGRALSGWLSAETTGSLTLRTAFGTEETVLRENISVLTASGVSLMPDGLEQTMTKSELAALIAYLKTPAEASP